MVHVVRIDLVVGPCPACGSVPRYHQAMFGPSGMRCDCGARGPTVAQDHRNAMENRAEEAWNRLIGFEQPPRLRPPSPKAMRRAVHVAPLSERVT